MSITNTNFTNISRLKNVNYHWLVHLYYDGSTTNYLALSTHDTTVGGTFYQGIVTKSGNIKEGIDLKKSVAKSGSASISIANKTYNGAPISKLFYSGTNVYLNNLVEIYIQPNDNNTLANCLQVFSGKVINIKHNRKTVDFQLLSERPWDVINMPQTKTNNGTNKPFPIVYGSFRPETSTVASPQHCNFANVWPAPVDLIKNNKFYCLLHMGVSDGRLHYYEPNAIDSGARQDIMVPMDEANNSSETYAGSVAITTAIDLDRAFRVSPQSVNNEGEYGYLSNPENLIDGNNVTYDEFNLDDYKTEFGGSSSSGTMTLTFEAPQIDHDIQTFKTYCRYEIDWDTSGSGGTDVAVSIDSYTFGGPNNIVAVNSQFDYNGSATTGNVSETSDGQMPDKIDLRFDVTLTGHTFNALTSLTIKIYEVYVEVETKIPIADTSQGNSANSSISNIKQLYCGSDGLELEITGAGSPVVTEIHEAHLDLLNRFAGFDVDTDPDTDITNWTALDADKDWGIRWWALKEVSLKTVLEKLQYEGGFIFKWRPDGSGSYWYVKDSYSSSDVASDLNDSDILDLEWGLTDFTDLITKINIDYEKHPAKSGYITTDVCTNSTARADYNIQAKENIVNIKLKAYVSPSMTTSLPGTNPNDDFASYYDNLFGSVKLLGSCNIINPVYFNLEAGDIIQYSGSDLPFGVSSLSTVYFMIEDVMRKFNSIKINFRQVA